MTKRRVLRGDHNQCPACAEYFNSTYAFDKHRTGTFGVDRRCMTQKEMREAGMAKNEGDWWISSAMEMAFVGQPVIQGALPGGMDIPEGQPGHLARS